MTETELNAKLDELVQRRLDQMIADGNVATSKTRQPPAQMRRRAPLNYGKKATAAHIFEPHATDAGWKQIADLHASLPPDGKARLVSELRAKYAQVTTDDRLRVQLVARLASLR